MGMNQPRLIKWPCLDSRQNDGMKESIIGFTDELPRIESHRIWKRLITLERNNGRKPTDWGPSAEK
jgi:hypothetical protein